MSAALADYRTNDLGTALWAWLARAPVGSKVVLEISSPVDPVDAGAIVVQPALQRFSNSLPQGIHFVGFE